MHQGALREWGYVACTRARNETRLYLTDHTHERETHGRAPEQYPLPERASRALARPAAEQLALEQAINETNARLLAGRQQDLDQLRTRAQERLAAAEAKLDTLGWRGRRKTRPRAPHGDHLPAKSTAESRRAAS